MNALNMDILDEAAALHFNMHDTRETTWLLTLQQVDIIATSRPLSFFIHKHSIPEWHPFTSETV